MAGRRCTICTHKQSEEINREIARGASFRAIAGQYSIKSKTSVERHVTNCLQGDVAAYIIAQKEEARLTVVEEFQKQLEYAKQLREAALKVLEDPDDPLKLTLDPWAHEIEVIYYDMNDQSGGDNPKPKKKRAGLQLLLSMLQLGPAQRFDDENMRDAVWAEVQDTVEPRDFATIWDKASSYFLHARQSLDLEAEKVQIKHVDLRKFALEAVSTTDMTIDKLAKIEGIYKQDQPNDPKARAVDAIKLFMALRPELSAKQAIEAFLQQQRERNVVLIEPAVMRQVAKDNGIMELEGVQ